MGQASPQQIFGIIPAAGRSRRMGRPKLLLPWDDTTVIGHLLKTLSSSTLARNYVLVRSDDEPLRAEVARHAAVVVQPPASPLEMRDSVQHLLQAVSDRERPGQRDGWLLVPGDHPLLRSDTLRSLVELWCEHSDAIVVPRYQGRGGHPTLFPWSLAADVAGLPVDRGINHLLALNRDRIRVVEVDDPTVTCDLDTPEDYRRALEIWRHAPEA